MLAGDPHPSAAAAQQSRASSGQSSRLPHSTTPNFGSRAPPKQGGRGSIALSPPAAPISPTVKDGINLLGESSAVSAPLEQVLQTGQPTFSTQLEFIKANRAVAAIERAVERLELLSLLDATGPAPTQVSADAGHKNATATAANASLFQQTSTRGPALLLGNGHEASMATAQKVAETLAVSQEHRSRGRATVLELLAEQRTLERRYGKLLMQAKPTVSLHPGEPQLNAHSFVRVNDATQAALQRELALVSGRLRDTNRLLCTQLQDNPQDMDNWAKVCNERRELTALLTEVINELTAGYKEAFQQQQRARAEASITNLGLENAPRRSIVNAGEHEDGRMSHGTSIGDSPAPTGNNTSVSGFVRSPSRKSSTVGGTAVSASSESGFQQTMFLKNFGATAQRRRASRNAFQGPRIPLSSSYQQFAVKILQEEASQHWADDVLAKERALNQNVKQLQADLVRELELKDKEVAERLARLSELHVELRNLKSKLQQRTEASKARGEAATENLQREGAVELRDVQQATRHDEQLLRMGITTHEAFSEYLRERTAAMETLAGEWEAKALRELKRKEAEKIDAEGNRQACAQRLTDLEHERSAQAELKARRETEQTADDEARRRSEDQRTAEYIAASVLESALKAMMTRQTLSKLQKGSKKKKKAG